MITVRRHRLTIVAALTAWIGALMAITPAAHDEGTDQISNILIADRMLHAAFPELTRDLVSVVVSVDATMDMQFAFAPSVGITVKRYDLMKAENELLLEGSMFVSVQTQLLSHVRFAGPYVHSADLEALTHRLDGRWTQVEVDDAIEAAGGRFSSRRAGAFAAQLNLGRFESVIGRIMQREDGFTWHIDSEDLNSTVIAPGWFATVETVQAIAGPRRCYTLWFEPYDGRLMTLSGSDCVDQ